MGFFCLFVFFPPFPSGSASLHVFATWQLKPIIQVDNYFLWMQKGKKKLKQKLEILKIRKFTFSQN